MSDNLDDTDGFDDWNDPDHRHFFAAIMVDLKGAKTADVFHQALGRAIRHAHTLNANELDEIADAASKPWTEHLRSKAEHMGRVRWIAYRYILTSNGKIGAGVPRPIRAEAIRMIMEDKKRSARVGERHPLGMMDEGRIGQLYNEAAKVFLLSARK